MLQHFLFVGQTHEVLELVRRLRDDGRGIVIISHNLDQIFRVTSGVWVLRRGRTVGFRQTAATRPEEIVGMITGAH